MTRRLITMLVLGVVLAPQGGLLASNGSHCDAQPLAPSALCSRCDLSGDSAETVSLSAASCCRFEAAAPRTQTPGILPSPQHALDTASPLALLPVSPWLDCLGPGSVGSGFPQARSTDSPTSLHNTLRL